ncbi:MAG: alpha/beta hydrolase [Planctomycetia bacterium]|nr:alpha/beta hydrolase [Planctomycetia bacterium]
MLFLENSQVYHPTRYDGGAAWRGVGPNCEDAWFKAADGTKLHGWYLPHDKPRAVVLFAHGNAGNVAHWVDVAQLWHDKLDVSVLVFDYRGYGRSEGSPSEAGLMADGRAARAWLATRAGVRPQDIVLWGRSIGGGVMVDLARDGARGLVLERTFTSLPDVAAKFFPWLPVHLLMRNRYDSLSKIGDYHGPLLMSHGDADSFIPFALSQKLFAAANEPKEFFAERGRDHNDPQPEEYMKTLRKFIEGLP